MNHQPSISPSISPFVRLKSIPIGACKWMSGFWAEKFQLCQDNMVPYMEELLCGDIGHALNNFKIAAGLKKGEHKGMYWHDGDFYKWIEAALYIYAQNGDEQLLHRIDAYIAIIGQAQEADGYLQTQIQLRSELDRYENRKYHEMYNTGHLLISACVHHEVTGKRNFLDIAIKHADLLYTIFFPESRQYGRFGFNQTQILGLAALYRATKDVKYLQLAKCFIDRRGTYAVEHHPTTEGYPIGDMVQERTPLRESSEAVGHAVLALYYYAGAAEVYAETGEDALFKALNRLWHNITSKKMYMTGAVGQTHYGASTNRDKIEEGFIDEYMLPNMTAYNETCANICNALFSHRMLGLNGEAKYADVMERVLYNSGLSGISLDGKKYFYANPLRMIHNSRAYNDHENATETPEREPYLECFCCPPNLVRTIAKSARWAYSLLENGVAVNVYGGNKLDTQLTDGTTLKLRQETHYPWEGKIKITIEGCKDTPFELWLRIPEWADNASLTINDEQVEENLIPGQFAKLNRTWKAGDEILLNLHMEAHWLEGHPRIEEVRNQVAISRGPVVYCIESPDLPQDTQILDVYIDGGSSLESTYRSDFLDGVCTIKAKLLLRTDQKKGLYRQVSRPQWQKHEAELIPYFAWGNRGLAEMTVFMPVVWNNS